MRSGQLPGALPGKHEQPDRQRRDPKVEGGAGITLIELVVAMAVAAFGLLGLLAFLVLMGRSEAELERATDALFCVQEKLEELRFLAVQGAFSQEGVESLTGGAYSGLVRHWKVSPDGLGCGLLHVEVDCSCRLWGREIRRSLETLVCAGE